MSRYEEESRDIWRRYGDLGKGEEGKEEESKEEERGQEELRRTSWTVQDCRRLLAAIKSRGQVRLEGFSWQPTIRICTGLQGHTTS